MKFCCFSFNGKLQMTSGFRS